MWVLGTKIGSCVASRRSLVVLCVLLVSVLRCTTPPTPAAAQSDVPLLYLTFNTDLEVDEAGDLHVRMVQQIAFGDTFSSAFFDIPTDYTTGISDVHVYVAATEDDNYDVDDPQLREIVPDSLAEHGAFVAVEWSYPPTVPGDVRLFVLEYTAHNVVWSYPDHNVVRWQAVNADRSGLTVEQSRVRLTLPPRVPAAAIEAASDPTGAPISQDGSTLIFNAVEPLSDGVPFRVEATFPAGFVTAAVQPWQRLADSADLALEVSRFHSDVRIHGDGTIGVTESTEIAVTAGALYQAYRAISLLYVEDVDQIGLQQRGRSYSESGAECGGCYVVAREPRSADWTYFERTRGEIVVREDRAGEVTVDWYPWEPVPAGQVERFQLSYRIVGGLRVNPDGQLLTWQVVPDYGVDVHNATFRLILPPGIDASSVTIEGPPGQGTPRLEPDGSLLFAFDGPVAPGGWQIALTLPAAATTATPPSWQTQLEGVIAQADAAAVAAARRTLLLRIGGIVLLVSAVLTGIVWWIRVGRRRVRESLHGYLSVPPSQSSPAVVAFLVDRKASEQGVLGALFFLATLGLVDIDLQQSVKFRRVPNRKASGTNAITDRYGQPVRVPPSSHLRVLYNQVVLPAVPADRWVTLDDLAPTLRQHLPDVYASLAHDVQGYFIGISRREPPKWPTTALWLVTYGSLIALLLLQVINVITAFAVAFVVLLGLIILSETRRNAAQYSEAGIVEADKWRRFKNYLLNLKEYGDLAAAQEILDRYFGYAVALGVEDVVLAQAAEMGVRRPLWMPVDDLAGRDRRPEPTASSGRSLSTVRWGFGRALGRRPVLVLSQRPSLAGMSAGLGSSLQNASRDLGRLLQTAAGDAGGAPRTVILESQLRRHEIEWQPGATVGEVLDGILKQSVDDAREIQRRNEERRRAARTAAVAAAATRNAHKSSWSTSSSPSRSSGGFGRSSSSRRSSPSRSSSSRSSSSRSGGGGRSGFR